MCLLNKDSHFSTLKTASPPPHYLSPQISFFSFTISVSFKSWRWWNILLKELGNTKNVGENLKSYQVGLSWCRISFLPSSLPWPGHYRSTLSAPAHEDLAVILVSKGIEEIPFLIPLHSTVKKKKKITKSGRIYFKVPSRAGSTIPLVGGHQSASAWTQAHFIINLLRVLDVIPPSTPPCASHS